MLSKFFIYLAEASVDLALFALAYRLLFQKLSHFQWNRVYLIASVLLSVLIPLLLLPWTFSGSSLATVAVTDSFWLNLNNLRPAAASGVSTPNINEQLTDRLLPYFSLGSFVFIVYLAGWLFNAWGLFKHLQALFRLIRNNKQTKEMGYTLIHTHDSSTPFSFLHYIFMHPGSNSLHEEELAQVLSHEQVHVAQRHTVDLLLFELAAIFFWFNPAVYYLKRQIRDVHEYQADAAVTQIGGSVKKYGQLLLKLATQQSSSPLLHTFSSKQIIHRITMLTQPKSSPMHKFRFLLVLPVLALTLFLSSFSGNKEQQTAYASSKAVAENVSTSADTVIRSITWTGNKAYSDANLTQALGLRKGDHYSEAAINNRMNYNPDGSDISSLYMDNGYMFFSITPKTAFAGNEVDVEFLVEEGPQMRIGQIMVKGNTKVSTAEMLEKMGMKSGELFSRAKIIKAQQAIIAMNLFKQEAIGINPIPHPEKGTTDIEFVLEEI